MAIIIYNILHEKSRLSSAKISIHAKNGFEQFRIDEARGFGLQDVNNVSIIKINTNNNDKGAGDDR